MRAPPEQEEGSGETDTFSRSAVLFSPRRPFEGAVDENGQAVTTQRMQQVASIYGVTHVVWHQPTPDTYTTPNFALVDSIGAGNTNCQIPNHPLADNQRCTVLPREPGWNRSDWRSFVNSWLRQFKDHNCRSLMLDDSHSLVGADCGGPSATQWLRDSATAIFGYKIPIFYNRPYFNNNPEASSLDPLAPILDGGIIAEIDQARANPNILYRAIKYNRALGMETVFTLKSANVTLYQQMIATTYALGAQMIVPYDVFLLPSSPRYFGNTEYYRHFYALVRSNPSLFEGYSTMAVYNTVGTDFVVGRLVTLRDTSTTNIGNTTAVLRRDGGSGRVLHLANWGGGERSYVVDIAKSAFSTSPGGATLFRPGNAPVPATLQSVRSV